MVKYWKKLNNRLKNNNRLRYKYLLVIIEEQEETITELTNRIVALEESKE